MDLTSLLERCRQGDDLAWEAFVRQFERRIYSIASGYASGPEEARDWAQDIFVRLYETQGALGARRGVRPVAGPGGPQRLPRPAAPEEGAAAGRGRPGRRDVGPGQRRTPSPEAALETVGKQRLVWRALQSLGHLSREIIQLKEIQGLSLEEVAAMLGVPIGTVKSRSNRARLELAERVLALETARHQGGATS